MGDFHGELLHSHSTEVCAGIPPFFGTSTAVEWLVSPLDFLEA
jgi:hypothetical protein